MPCSTRRRWRSPRLMVCIADRDQIIAVSGGPKKEYYQKTISRALELAVSERQNICAARGEKAFIPITSDEMEESSAEVIVPILSEGDAIGAVILLSREAKQALGRGGDEAGGDGSRISGTSDGRIKKINEINLPGNRR